MNNPDLLRRILGAMHVGPPHPADVSWLAQHGLATLEAIEAEARAEGPDCCDWQHQWPCPTIPRCDQQGCVRQATHGWPTPSGLAYRHTCGEHSRGARRIAAALDALEDPR